MRKIAKITISLLCVLAVLFSMLIISHASTVKLTVGSVKVEKGTGTETVDVPIVISGNTGIIGMTVTINYGEGLTLTAINKGDALPSLTMTKSGNLSASPVKATWDGEAENDYSNGTALTLSFVVPKNIEKEYPIEISVSGVIDENINRVVMATENGKITVAPQEHIHSYGTWSKDDENTHSKACVCGDKITEVHSWDSGAVTTPGTKTYTCLVCNGTKTEAVQNDSAQAPTANRKSGVVESGAKIELYTQTAKATIYYTIDGSAPSASKTKYTGAITITEDTVIKAIAVKDGYDNSDIATFTYTIADENAPTVYISGATGAAGESVVVTINIKNNPGVLGMMLRFSYDEALTLTALEQPIDGAALESLDFTPEKNYLTTNSFNVAWDGLDADYTNGILLNATFTIPENAENADLYDINLSYAVGDVYDNDFNDIDLIIINKGVFVKNYIIGDVSDDGIINMKDVTMLRRGVVGGYGITLNEAADVNCDGITNMKDVTMLRRYVVGGYGVVLG